MATDSMEKEIPAFRRHDFESYVQTLRSSCTTGKGSIALTARYDPITAHINDPFVKAKIDAFSGTEKRRFRAGLPTKEAILAQPNLVEQALPHLVNFKAFAYIVPAGQDDDVNLFRNDYLALKAKCEVWSQSEAAIYRVCIASLRRGDMLDLCDERVSSNFAVRLLLQKITAAGANFSDKA